MKSGKSMILGALSGAAAAIFLQTEKGKEVKEKVLNIIDDYKENPEEYNQQILDKTVDLKDKTVDLFVNYKTKFETGELTAQDVLDTAQEKASDLFVDVRDAVETVVEKVSAKETVEELKDKAVQATNQVTPTDEDIIIDLVEEEEADQEEA